VKKLLYLLLAFQSITLACPAQNKSPMGDPVSLSFKTDTESITYNFDTIKDLEENLELLLNEIVNNMDETVSFPVVIEVKTCTSLTKTELTSTINSRTITETAIKNLYAPLQKDLSQKK